MKGQTLSQEDLRQKAIDLYNQNWKVSEICSMLGCSRSWFYKWINRYNDNDETWFREKSRNPKSIPSKIDSEMEQLVVDTRKDLIAAPFSQYGPQAIFYAISQKGYTPPPVWTIARILKRRELVHSSRSSSYISKGKKYPYEYAFCHQMDFVGPRYLSCKARYYFLNLIDCDSHWCQTSVLENQRALSICDCLIKFWKVVGVPDFLQMDNDLSFWGSLKKPGALGRVIRLCLLNGVTPVFIPQGEPWRNGIMESFNNTMQKHLLSQEYNSIEHLQKNAAFFDKIHNETHHYSSQKGMTSKEAFKQYGYPIRLFDQSYEIPNSKLSLEPGEIHVIRFIRKDRKFNIFGLTFLLPENVIHEYVRGIILTEEHRILIFNDKNFIDDFEFILY